MDERQTDRQTDIDKQTETETSRELSSHIDRGRMKLKVRNFFMPLRILLIVNTPMFKCLSVMCLFCVVCVTFLCTCVHVCVCDLFSKRSLCSVIGIQFGIGLSSIVRIGRREANRGEKTVSSISIRRKISVIMLATQV